VILARHRGAMREKELRSSSASSYASYAGDRWGDAADGSSASHRGLLSEATRRAIKRKQEGSGRPHTALGNEPASPRRS
jgi:hypothetical protein